MEEKKTDNKVLLTATQVSGGQVSGIAGVCTAVHMRFKFIFDRAGQRGRDVPDKKLELEIWRSSMENSA